MATFATVSCAKNESNTPDPTALDAIWVVSEGNFNSSNAKITAYDPMTKKTTEDLFGTANGGASLGDTPTQVKLYNNLAYIALSNSGKVYMLDPKTAVLKDKITDLHSPRYFAFVSPTKGYISNINESTITIFNPSTSTVTGKMHIGSAAEQMVVKGDYIYANQWSFGTQLIKIDTKTDKVVDSLVVGIQPICILPDAKGNFWTLCDGGWEGKDVPKIVRVLNLGDKMTIGNVFELPAGTYFNFRMAINGAGDRIYYVAGNMLFSMSIDATALPTEPIAKVDGASFYSLAINPFNGEIYCSDAVDYKQPGVIYRFDSNGKLLDQFSAGGVSPSAYLF